jgi:hypothetical protein
MLQQETRRKEEEEEEEEMMKKMMNFNCEYEKCVIILSMELLPIRRRESQ